MESVVYTCSRRPHKKSRSGCARCKKRKIKCDELKPSCQNCLKHSVQCDFQLSRPSLSWGSPKPPSPYASTSNHATSQVSIASPTSQGNTIYSHQQLPALNMLDLELLHNFTNSTCNTFHSDPILKTLWRINIPQLAFSCDFVMRGMLALSALHLAYFRPERQEFLLSHAMLQHEVGLREATSILSDVTDENCTYIYIFSVMTCMFTLASPRKSDDFLVFGESGISEWLILCRGIRTIIEASQETLKNGVLGPMFIAGGRRYLLREQISEELTEEGEQLDQLLNLIKSSSKSQTDLEIYTTAIHELRKSFSVVFRPDVSLESGDVFIWFFRIPKEYLVLLRERTQEALTIFAYFCVIPKRLEFNWWIEGWSTHLISRIYNLLDNEHRLYVRWPIEQIGWVPN